MSQTSSSEPKFFKVVLIGDGGVGKTTFIKRHMTGEFEKKYMPTLGVEVHPLDFHTSHGRIVFNIWDTAGQEKFGGLRDGYYIGAHAFILFASTVKSNTLAWLKDIRRLCPTIPGVLVWNKCDITEHRSIPEWFSVMAAYNELPLYSVSAKSNFNFAEPFLSLAATLMNEPHLQFIESPLLKPVEVPIDSRIMKSYERALKAARETPLPDEKKVEEDEEEITRDMAHIDIRGSGHVHVRAREVHIHIHNCAGIKYDKP